MFSRIYYLQLLVLPNSHYRKQTIRRASLHVNFNYFQRFRISSQSLCKLLYKFFFAKSQSLQKSFSTSALTLNFKKTDYNQHCSVSSYSQRIVLLPKDCASIRFCCDRRPYARFSLFVISFFSEALSMGNMVLLSLNDCWLFYTDLNPHHFLTVKTTTFSNITKLNLETF